HRGLGHIFPAVMHALSFYWHDYETFGLDTRRDRPAQFAGIRTNDKLEEIGEPLMIYCQPAPDYLPDPESCLLTGITPQRCLEKGLPEFAFAARIEEALATPGTVGLGYNTIRFDDEVTRFLLWRNLYDPYAREWQNDCSRWDLLDVVRTTYALRPEGIEWPLNEEGNRSFKLEHLTAANGIAHATAHDALSDVRATIALARFIRDKQPRLFDFCFSLRKKDRVLTEIGWPERRPFLHVSGMFPAERGCISIVWPLAEHPTNKNELIVWDLAHDPSELFTLDIEAIRRRLFTRNDELPIGESRLPIKGIHINKSPIVVGNLKTLTPEMAERWGLNLTVAMKHMQSCQNAPDMRAIWTTVYERSDDSRVDVDADLYGGFIGNNDRRLLARLRNLSPEKLALERVSFEDGRLEELLHRYRARNFRATLNAQEAARWEELRAGRLFDGLGGARTLDVFGATLDRLAEHANEHQLGILSALSDYAESIIPDG
ncbi:MAG TPA: exodeoxyribonuclease I, partial [Rhodocyclaceae bacterium]|nr:exodeoxyribonuclease I [Rhodocyclaceae bacterium]